MKSMGKQLFLGTLFIVTILLIMDRFSTFSLLLYPMKIADDVSRGQIPKGFFDSVASGVRAANQDIQRNDIKFGVYGLVERPIDDSFAKFQVTPVLLGCIVGAEGSSFWKGYNQTVLAVMRLRGVDFPADSVAVKLND